MNFLPHIKSGDWLALLSGLMLVSWLFATLWQGGGADRAIIRSGGAIFAEASLARNQTIPVPGPLGVSLISIQNHRVRVAQDPSPRQYCVKQGWLSHAGDAAICMPNRVSVELAGATRRYDSVNY